MGKGYRTARLSEEIKKIISELLLREIKDPVLTGNMISVTGVSVTSDGSYATCYISVLGASVKSESSEQEKSDVLLHLDKAKGLIRREIAKKIKVRHVPELIFKSDDSMEYGRHMSKVLDDLKISEYDSERQDDGAGNTVSDIDEEA